MTRDETILAVLPVAYKVARRMYEKWPRLVDWLDLRGEAVVYAIEAVDKFDPHRKCSIQSWVWRRVRSGLRDFYMRHDMRSRGMMDGPPRICQFGKGGEGKLYSRFFSPEEMVLLGDEPRRKRLRKRGIEMRSYWKRKRRIV